MDLTTSDLAHRRAEIDRLARLAAAVTAAVASGTAAALILGEYEFTGATPFLAAAVVGLVLAEVVLAVARRRVLVLTGAASLSAGGAILWAGYITTGSGVAAYPGVAWPAAALAAAAAGLRTWPPTAWPATAWPATARIGPARSRTGRSDSDGDEDHH